MPVIVDILTARGQGAYYCEDLAALQESSVADADRWTHPAITPGFKYVREVAETLSVGFVLDDGTVAWGDCVGVSYGGKAGRDPVFRAAEGVELIARHLPWKGTRIERFRESATQLDALPLPAAVRYGLSQALLFAFAGHARKTPAEIIAGDWGLRLDTTPLALQGSCGNDRVDNVDKMIVNRLEALPHGQVDDFATQFGQSGEKLLGWADGIVKRLKQLAPASYRPVLHFDVHGALGRAFPRLEDQVVYLRKLASAAGGYAVRLESAILAPTRDLQIEGMKTLRSAAHEAQIKVAIVADEWANTSHDIEQFAKTEAVDMVHIKMPDLGSLHNAVDAVLACRRYGTDTLLGGSCIETDLSSKASVHVGLATRPTALLVKPGMGINEGISLYRNEIARTQAIWAVANQGSSRG